MEGRDAEKGVSTPDEKTSLNPLKKSSLTPRRLSSYDSLSEEEQQIVHQEGLSNNYDIESVITWRVFTFIDGTILQSRVLWMETLMMGLAYWSVVLIMYEIRWKNFSEFVGSESSIRAFIAMFSTLIGLLLSFYTALNLGRWWQMRMGVQNIQEASKKLTVMISQGVTQDDVLLSTIHRYARASLFLIFAAAKVDENHQEHPLQRAVTHGFLTQEEADKLGRCNPHQTFVQAETLWVWLGNAVTSLQNQGLTKGAPHYCALMNAVEMGRNGVAEIESFLETPIPLGYVHLLCLMVKLHNGIVTLLMAMATVMLAGGEKGFQPVGVCRVAFRAFFMPFLYNAILILNAEVVDPFGADAADFKFSQYDVNMLMSNRSFCKAAENLPDCLAQDVKPIKK